MVTLDYAHSFENNSVTASCNIRYQIIIELDIFTDATPVDIYAASWLHAQFVLNYKCISYKQSFGNFPILITILNADCLHKGIIYL